MDNIKVKTQNGVEIILEKPKSYGTVKAGGKDKLPDFSQKVFETMLSSMLGCAEAFSNKLNDLSEINNSPKSASVEFGLSLDLEGNFFVAKVNSETHFNITLLWDDFNGNS